MNKNKKTIKAIIFLVAFIAIIVAIIAYLPNILSFLGYILWILTPFIIAYIVSILANPMADTLQKRFRLPRSISAVLVIILIVGVIGGILTGVIWKIIDEIKGIYNDFPVLYSNFQSTWYAITDSLSSIVDNLPQGAQDVINDFSEQIMSSVSHFAKNTAIFQSASNAAKKLPSIFISIIVFLISLYFMVADSNDVADTIKKPFPEKLLKRFIELKLEIKRYIGGYIKAQGIIMCIAFVILLIGLSILKVKYALIIALSTAIVDALPFFGSGTVLIPWAVISFMTGSISRGVGLLIIYLSVILTRQMIEPKIVGKSIGMHPLLTLIAMYTGYRVFSLGGMILGPFVLMLLISLYKIGMFDEINYFIKNISLKLKGEFKNIKSFFDNEGD